MESIMCWFWHVQRRLGGLVLRRALSCEEDDQRRNGGWGAGRGGCIEVGL